MKKILASGKTIDDAVQSGLTQLNVTKDRVKVLVMEQPSKGLFGLIGVKAAKVELELIPDPTIEAEQFLRDVAEAMGLTVAVERKQTRDATYLSVSGGGDIGMLIGRRGQTLDALQYLVNIVANRYSDSHLRIVLDAEDFRERRRKTLEELSERLAGRVIRTKKEVVLEPMSSHERKVIHSQLQNHPRVKTYSKGDEPNRRVVIALKEKQM
ncbi:RNA-binding cell elongation regulator Jag/EloR [Paenibacillus lupini]|uniref:RNA-binding cell elongation regulator Jag/EloR n=1 Tax=Paenibacillus lupini TaxID=1450204 RepID=UPI001421FEED|nr:RNA-binding cell elongation regulator Jag/EloR [Paenibacillus lupini]NIK25913.1 spoIIIJ-associated protein [Paenibacillus lupini]